MQFSNCIYARVGAITKIADAIFELHLCTCWRNNKNRWCNFRIV